jgi:hypothetical protein
VEFDLASWGGSTRATDALTGRSAAWTGKARIALPGESGAVYRLGPERARGTGKKAALTPIKPESAPDGTKVKAPGPGGSAPARK